MYSSTSTSTYRYSSTTTTHTYRLGEKGFGFQQAGGVQDFDKLRDECFAEGRLFEDPTFDAVDSSLFFSKPVPSDIQWKRPTEFVNDPHFFVEGVSRFDVVQGELGDCWLLAAVSNLTLLPALFYQVVPDDQGFASSKKYAGIFRFKFWQYGKWIEVVVDDRLPIRYEYKQLVFLHSRNHNEFWSALLEKAYAKLHGSYEALQSGNTCDGLADFTGGLTESYQITTLPPKDAPELTELAVFTIMQKALERASLMGCSIIHRGQAATPQKLPNGLMTFHAYSITDIKTVHMSSQKIPLLRIRNPWGGDNEWKGAWSDQSSEWQNISETEKKSLGLVVAFDGEFWMSFSDFLVNFTELEVCHLHPGSIEKKDAHSSHKQWECQTFDGSWVRGATAGGCSNYEDTFPCNPQYRIVLDDPDEDAEDNKCTVIVSLMQKNRRAQRKMGLRELSIGFRIYYLENPDSISRPLPRDFLDYNDAIAKTKSFNPQRENTGRFKLAPGTYCIVPSTFKPNEEAEFLLRVYSEKKNEMQENDREVSVTGADENAINDAKERHASDLINETFRRIAGADLEVDATELKAVLDHILKKEFDFPGFGINLCRGLVAMKDTSLTGKLSIEEFKELWLNIATWKGVFKMYDKENSGTLTSFQLRDALGSAGYHLNSHVLKVLILRYANRQNNEISVEDFLMCAVKLKTMCEAFKERDKNGSNEATFKLEEWVKLTMYS